MTIPHIDLYSTFVYASIGFVTGWLVGVGIGFLYVIRRAQ